MNKDEIEKAASLLYEDGLPMKLMVARIMAISDAKFDNRAWPSMAKTERVRYVERSLSAINTLSDIGIEVTGKDQ